MITPQILKETLPRSLHINANQEFADKLNQLMYDPETCDEIRGNFLTYAKVLTEGKYKVEDYLAAITYATHKFMGYSNKEAYTKTFPQRYAALVARGATEKDISAYVSAYHKNQMVTKILEQAMIPVWVMGQDMFQKAIQTQYSLMTDIDVAPKVRAEAANSLLTHLKPPVAKKVEVDIGMKENSGMADLRQAMTQLAKAQLKNIEEGGTAKQIAQQVIVVDAEDVEFEDV